MTTKSKPILFSAPMVQALLREIENPGTGKTQTRRVIKPQPRPLSGEQLLCGVPSFTNDWAWPHPKFDNCTTVSCKPNGPVGYTDHCPYGKIGDLLYVREACRADYDSDGVPTVYFPANDVSKSADDVPVVNWLDMHHYRKGNGLEVRSIHMPRWASRITLEVTDVRVERLMDISEEDAKAEGVEKDDDACDHKYYSCEDIGCLGPTFKCGFADLWCSINGDDSWRANPWVWAVSFKPHLINVDRFIEERAAA